MVLTGGLPRGTHSYHTEGLRQTCLPTLQESREGDAARPPPDLSGPLWGAVMSGPGKTTAEVPQVLQAGRQNRIAKLGDP